MAKSQNSQKNYKRLRKTKGQGKVRKTREKLRKFFEVSSEYVAFSAIHSLFKSKKISKDLLKKAVKELNIDTKKTNPFYV